MRAMTDRVKQTDQLEGHGKSVQQATAQPVSFEPPVKTAFDIVEAGSTFISPANLREPTPINHVVTRQTLQLQGLINDSPQVQQLERMQQRIDSSPRMAVQRKSLEPHPGAETTGPKNPNALPDPLRAGIERLSGLSVDDVRVHYHSAKPARLQALAYTQGTDIHVGPGQESHLPHEAWHVVQQKEGRVQPTTQVLGVALNDDPALEKEADAMGAKALQLKGADQPASHRLADNIGRSTGLSGVGKPPHKAGIVQAKRRKGPIPTANDEVIQTWELAGDKRIKLWEVPPSGGAERTWKLVLYDENDLFLGHIFIYYHARARQLKPDGLEVPKTAQGLGYGATLGRHAVMAMELPELRTLSTDAETVFLNLVNPLSAHISIKELNLRLNGGDPQNDTAVEAAKAAIKQNKRTSRLYKKEQFPNFWGRLVHLALNNGVRFMHARFPGDLDANHEFTSGDAQIMLDSVLGSKAGTFGLNIEAPLPEY